jgi:serine/threonine protein phosphatase 1
MTARIIAVGDIHGCSRACEALIAAIAPQPDDILVLLGDYVDRGPDSRGVLDQLVALVDSCMLVPLLGNHEILMLDAILDEEVHEFWKRCGGEETLASYGGSLDNVPAEHLVFLRGLRPFFETDSHLFVHANYDERLPLSQTPPSILFWEHIASRMPRPHRSGKTVIVGHTPQANGRILDLGYVVCLDTYCFGGGWLTALDVQNRRIWQANQDGELRLE